MIRTSPESDWTREYTIRTPHEMFEQLRLVDNSFTQFYDELFDRFGMFSVPSEELYKDRLEGTLLSYIDLMQQSPQALSPKEILNYGVSLYNLDPVFAVLLRAIAGPEVLTFEVSRKIRSSWCYSDLPEEVWDACQETDDKRFQGKFNRYSFSPGGNIKMKALRDSGLLADLVEARRTKKPVSA